MAMENLGYIRNSGLQFGRWIDWFVPRAYSASLEIDRVLFWLFCRIFSGESLHIALENVLGSTIRCKGAPHE